MPAKTCVGSKSGKGAYTGNPAEAKNLAAGDGIKSVYSIHTGDLDAGENANPGRGIAIANHDGKNKYCRKTGNYVPTGRNLNSAVFAETGDHVPIVVGSITMDEALENVSLTVCVK